MFEPTVRRARDAGLDVRAYVSMCFGDPWEGDGPDRPGGRRRQAALRPRRQPAQPRRHHRRRHRRPRDRAARRVQRRRAGRRPARRALPRHLRPGAGQHLRRAAARVTTFDACAGGLGGCPYAKSATGNLATEDLVWMLHGLGIETGVDLDALVATSVWMAGELGRPSPSAVVDALAGRRRPRRCTISRMSRVVYLHVGAPKTGTTYLQDRLGAQPAALAEHGVHYPTRPARRASSAPRSTCSSMPWGGLRDDAEGEWDALVEAGPRRPAAPWSSATRSSPRATPEQVARAMAELAGSRGARRLLRPRPGPADPRRVAGEHQAPAQAVGFGGFLNQVRGRPRTGRPVVLAGAEPARRARAGGARAAARAGARGHRAAARRRRATCCGSATAGPSASTRPGRREESDRANVVDRHRRDQAGAPAQPPAEAGRAAARRSTAG